MPNSRIRLLTDELNSLKRKEKTVCYMEVVSCKLADTKSELSNLVSWLRHESFKSYASICHNVDQTLLVVGSHQREVINRDAKELQLGFHKAFCSAVGEVQQSFVYAPKVVDGILSLNSGSQYMMILPGWGFPLCIWRFGINDNVKQVPLLTVEKRLGTVLLKTQRLLFPVRRILVTILPDVSWMYCRSYCGWWLLTRLVVILSLFHLFNRFSI